MSQPSFKSRFTWKNDAGNQESEPLRAYEPESAEEIVRVVQAARRVGVRVRAVGSGHSWSDVAVSEGFLVRPDGLDRVLTLDADLLRPDVDTSAMVQIESGVRLRELNEKLWNRGLALPNMGGYDGQTMVGAISTSTHGSGISFGPLNEMVRSIELVTASGRLVRVEPAGGITDPAKYRRRYPDEEARGLVQDDTTFHAVLVGMGCMGVIYSLILQVREAFHLKEVRTLSTWSEVKRELRDGVLHDPDSQHYEVLINLHRVGADNRCVVTRRNEISAEEAEALKGADRRRPLVAELPGFLQRILGTLSGGFLKAHPKLTPQSIDDVLEGLVDTYGDRSYRVFNIGTANYVRVVSAEYALPLEGDVYLDAIDALIEEAGKVARLGVQYTTAPVSIRFVKASPALLSMMHGRDTCMVEVFLLWDTQGLFEILNRYEDVLYAFDVRPHWGQFNRVSGALAARAYGRAELEAWQHAREELNRVDGTPGHGMFDNPFTKRLGLYDTSYGRVV